MLLICCRAGALHVYTSKWKVPKYGIEINYLILCYKEYVQENNDPVRETTAAATVSSYAEEKTNTNEDVWTQNRGCVSIVTIYFAFY